MTNQQGAPEALRPITRYEVVDCIDSKHVPAVIPNRAGPWVRYEDHVAALVEAQQPAPSAAAALPEGGPPGSGGWEKHAVEMERQRDYYRQRCDTMEEFQRGDAWCWQGDGGDNLESMGNSMLVAIRADQLRSLMARSPTPQADSQPAPVAAFEVADAIADSQYLAGVSAGWNAANADDPNAALQKLHESRAGYLKPLRAARAPADSVTAPATESYAQPVPDKCDRIVWRGHYYHLPLTPPAQAADSVPAPTHAQIAAYLEATGAYVTNDATRKAAIAEAVNADRAARAPADSVTAPAGATNTKTHELLSTTVGLLIGYREGGARQPYKPSSVIAKVVDEVVDHLKGWPYPEPPTPTQAQAGAVVVTTDTAGQCVAVTRQDDEGRVLSIIWQAPEAHAGAVPLTDNELVRRSRVGAIQTDENGKVVMWPVYYRTQMEDRFKRGWREAEKHYGIKGGQHGADT